MNKHLVSVLVAAVAGASLVAAGSASAVETGVGGACDSGVLATDASGDDTYAGQTGTGLESPSGDILEVTTSLTPDSTGSVAFTTKLRDLEDTDPAHFDLLVSLDLLTDAGDTIAIDARRSNALGASATVDGEDAEDVEFDNEADTVTVTVPASVFDDVDSLSLELAQTRYDSGALLSPLADEASGECTLVLNPDAEAPQAGGEDLDLDTTILVVDTGVNGEHPEFADDQIVAWWDFSHFPGDDTHAAGDPNPGLRTWFDTNGDGVAGIDDTYDPEGHGSAVASMAAGRNVIPAKTPSACPGCDIAFAKVQNQAGGTTGDGVLDGSIGDAIRWGVDVVGVDVVTVSIGGLAPIPAAVLAETYDAAAYARSKGVLVLFANGNGWGNAGIPGQPGGFMPYGNSTNVLSVGADDLDSYLVTTDPEVVAVFNVHAAGPNGSEYQDISGTSFSTPFTAGVAARIVGESRACANGNTTARENGEGKKKGLDDTYGGRPDDLERLIEYTAADRPDVPPTFEGYGVVTLETMQHAVDVACGRAELPEPDALNDLYVTNVSGTERQVSTTDPRPFAIRETPVTDVTAHGVLGASTPSGGKDAEVYTLTVAPRTTVTVDAVGTGDMNDTNDFDMKLFAEAEGPTYGTLLASSGNGGAVHESIIWTNATDEVQTVSLVVYGWSIVQDQPFTLSATGATSTLGFDGYVTQVENLLG